MIHSVEEVNKRTDIKSLVVLSTDVSAMFPSLDIPECARVAGEELYNSDIDINVDDEELALYLAVTVDRERLEDLGLGEVVHTRIIKLQKL